MKKNFASKGIVALALVLSMLFTLVLDPVLAVAAGTSNRFETIDNSTISSSLIMDSADIVGSKLNIADDEIVRVSVVLQDKSAIDSGYSTENLLDNTSALRYIKNLKNTHTKVENAINDVLDYDLDVKHTLSITANIISAEVAYGDIEKIEAVSGVSKVILETEYFPCTAEEVNQPQMAISSEDMTGVQTAWKSGNTGSGARIAIIDTGLDIDHQSFNNDAFLYAIKQDAKSAKVSEWLYTKSLFLLDANTIKKALPYLNSYEQLEGNVKATDLVVSGKIPYAFNYVDGDFDVTHVNDTQGEHGSHVAGIASANRYLKVNGKYVDSLSNVGVAGNAPDAQVLVMKVFGKNGGAYDSDYMAAIEDALLLGCDSVNLSLGSASAGFTVNKTYQDILNKMTKTDSVVVMSAGNSGSWADNTFYGDLYADGVNYDTAGSPGTYTNSLCVASVNNAGAMTEAFTVADALYSFTESTTYGNVALSTLAGDSSASYEYVFIDGTGNEEDYEGIDVTGKIVFVKRGEISFYVKANIAVSKGAIATIIYNNTSGTIGLNLTGYEYTAPCVSITLSDAEAIKAASTAVDNYYVGTITIDKDVHKIMSGDDYYTMSSFSSWGVPGTLTMKPEITAPGGSIYSVNGTNNEGGGTDQYELMSGTSMAAPQVTGMTAVLKRYIERTAMAVKGLVGLRLNNRALAQSLLMSTATPMVDANGNYYSVMQQGAGLANINDAINAKTVVAMANNATASAADGKVKAELGDDPSRTGKYTFNFTLTNISGKAVTYDLSADLFTQATDGEYLYGDTMEIPGKATFYVNGRKAKSVTVYAGLTSVINVTLTLDQETKDFFDTYLPTGAYVEAYVKAVPRDKSSAHTIPVLAYYGNWTDPSMFDLGSYTDYKFNLEDRAPYLYEVNGVYGNAFTVEDGDGEYYFGANLYATEKTYHPEFASINNLEGDKLKAIYFSLIRNAGALAVSVRNAETGEAYIAENLGSAYAAYYSASSQSWRNTSGKVSLNWAGTDAEGNALPEGTKVEVSLIAVPEYYCDAEGNFDESKLGTGAYLTTSLTIDNTAPELEAVADEDEGILSISAKDNLGIAAVMLFSDNGKELIARYAIGASEIENAVIAEGLEANVYVIAIVDYAGNMSAYRVFMKMEATDDVESVTLDEESITLVKNNSATLSAEVSPMNVSDDSVVWSSSDESVAIVNEDGVVTAVGVGTCKVIAASALDATVTASCEVNVIEINTDLNAFVWDEEGNVLFTKINTASVPEYEKLTDNVYNARVNAVAVDVDGTIYASDLDTDEGVSNLYTMDPESYELSLIGTSSVAYTDLAAAPSLGGLLATYFNYLVLVDPTTGDYYGAFNYLANGELVGVTYIGSTYNKNYDKYLDMFYLLDSEGNLYFEAFIEIGGKYYYFNGSEDALIGSTGVSCDTPYFQSLYFNGEYTFISNFNEGQNCVTLYAVDTEVSGEVFNLGSYADGIWPVAGLFELPDTTDADLDTTAHTLSEGNLTEAVDTIDSIVSRGVIKEEK